MEDSAYTNANGSVERGGVGAGEGGWGGRGTAERAVTGGNINGPRARARNPSAIFLFAPIVSPPPPALTTTGGRRGRAGENAKRNRADPAGAITITISLSFSSSSPCFVHGPGVTLLLSYNVVVPEEDRRATDATYTK